MPYTDLREFIAFLEKNQQLSVVGRPITMDIAVVRKVDEMWSELGLG
jgi:3-polyprenyl-4-hydroxybenzoate decarboxylase